MAFLSSYRALFSLPKFGASLCAAAAGKLRPGLSSLSLLLGVAHYRGFGQAAVVVSVSAATGALLPLRGRLMDRYGYTRGMVPALVTHLCALTVLVLNERARGPFATTLVVTFLAGVSAPPIQIVTRLMWREMTTGALRTTALSLDTMLTDLGFIVGPTIAAFLVVFVAPWAGLAASALLCTTATLLLLSRKLPHRREPPRSVRGHWTGPLRSRGLRGTMAAATFFFLAVRAIELAFPVWAQQHDMPVMSGVLLSCMSVGSVTGGLVLGGLPPRWSVRARLPVTLAALCLGTVLVAAASFTRAPVLIVATVLTGLALGPSFVALWATAGELSARDSSAETLSWISSFMSLGGAAGAAVGSAVAHQFGPGALLALAAVSLAAGSALAHLAVKDKTVTFQQAPGIDTHGAVNTETQ